MDRFENYFWQPARPSLLPPTSFCFGSVSFRPGHGYAYTVWLVEGAKDNFTVQPPERLLVFVAEPLGSVYPVCYYGYPRKVKRQLPS